MPAAQQKYTDLGFIFIEMITEYRGTDEWVNIKWKKKSESWRTPTMTRHDMARKMYVHLILYCSCHCLCYTYWLENPLHSSILSYVSACFNILPRWISTMKTFQTILITRGRLLYKSGPLKRVNCQALKIFKPGVLFRDNSSLGES